MNVCWLLDATIFPEYHDELAAAIVRNGHVVKSLNRPNAPYGWDDAPEAYREVFPENACVVTYADIDLVLRVKKTTRWTPGTFAPVEKLHCSHYYAYLGQFLLNRDYTMLPFGELRRCEGFLFDTWGRDGRIFVRPDSPLKLFAGMMASREQFARDVEFMGFYDVPAEALVVVSSPKTISTEWRFVIADSAIVAGSKYKVGDSLISSPADDAQANALAEAILATGFAPDRVWVMDICQTSDQKYHLLEIGAFSFANLYGCDKDSVVTAVSSVALELHRDTPQI